jgi:hypothetical protein
LFYQDFGGVRLHSQEVAKQSSDAEEGVLNLEGDSTMRGILITAGVAFGIGILGASESSAIPVNGIGAVPTAVDSSLVENTMMGGIQGRGKLGKRIPQRSCGPRGCRGR